MKKYISLFLALITVMTVFFGISIAAQRPGDVNSDGEVNNKDVVTLFRYVSGGNNGEYISEYDFNGDGEVNNKDVVSLFRAVSTNVLPEETEEETEEEETTAEETANSSATEAEETEPETVSEEETEPDEVTEEEETEPDETTEEETEPEEITEDETEAEETEDEETAAETVFEEESSDEETETEQETEPLNITPKEGSTVSLLSELMTEWALNYERGKVDDIWDYTEKCGPVPVHFSWDDDADYTNLFLSENPDMSDPTVFLCNTNELDVEDLLPGTQYFWQTVCTKNGENVRSSVHSFTTLQTIRTVSIPGVSNVRDLGGKITSEGKRVKYGMVYRGADFEKITKDGKSKAVDVLGIKTELDLREAVANGKSKLGKTIKYVSVTAPLYYQIKEADYRDDLLKELQTFADPDNYPIYFHCSLGRDRTGTLAFILQALLGVEEEDIYMDYEVSFFSSLGGYIVPGSESDVVPSKMLPLVDNLKNTIWPSTKNRLRNVRAYLKNLGLTNEEMDAIRSILLEDVK